MIVDHAFTLPPKVMYPQVGAHWPVRAVPVAINSVQHLLPTAARCGKLGQAIVRAVSKVTCSYHVPASNTGRAIMLLRNNIARAPLMAD